MKRLLDITSRQRRSLLHRARQLRRALRSFNKCFYKRSPVREASLSEIPRACQSKAELLQVKQDCIWQAIPAETVRCTALKNVFPGKGTRNADALQQSLSESSFDSSPIVIGRFHNCIAEPLPIRLVTQDGDLISETSRAYDLLDPDFLGAAHLVRSESRLSQINRVHRHIDRDVLFVFNSITPSYGHYVLTVLPIVFLFLEEIRRGRFQLVLPAELPQWMKSHLLEIGLGEANLLTLSDSSHQFRSATVANILDARNTRAPNPGSLQWLAEVIGLKPARRTPRKKLFLRRSGIEDLSSRTMLNEPDVIRTLEADGFTVIEPAKMSLWEQVRAFQAADLIVSPHGSTLANVLFCRPGTRILDLMPDDWVGARGDSVRDVWGLRICALADAKYSVLLCPSHVPTRHFTGNPIVTYEVSIPDLLQGLQNF